MPTKAAQWSSKNKLLILFILLTLCLFATTVALGVQNRALVNNAQKNEAYSKAFNKSDTTNYRLPRNVIPQSYKLKLHPGENKTFEGIVTIKIKVLYPTKRITLHSHLLIIKQITLMDKKQSLTIASSELSEDATEFLHVDLGEEINPGPYYLTIEYSGKLTSLVGFYESTRKNGRKMVASKFEPTYARQAFPCFDEPDFKATFDITLVKPISYVALSNMNVISSKANPDGKTEAVTFATSVPMSTYLACFVICDFEFKETEINSNGIGHNFKLRSFAQKDQMHKIDFAQDIGKRATEFYIKYYEVPFPLPKLDMIAIPDYQSGATEHWGLITYRETSFLVDEATASALNKIAVANTIAHELAHMWFGNLVTMKWWDDLWLNEGFASYMQVKVLNAIEPSWTMMDQFLTKTLHSVLKTDARLSSHPIVQIVKTPDQITAIFDSISYNKGASVIRMLEGFMGEENFRKGISEYLKKYQFGNTVTKDLLSSLEPFFKQNNPNLHLNYIMDTWTRQMGYPLLTVSQGENPDTFVITQSRFLLNPDAVYENDSPFNYRWFVPITYKTNKRSKDDTLWFPDTEDNVKITLKEGENWLKINNNQVGYYRVNYTRELWNKLINVLQHNPEQLGISDRANLLSDVFALAGARIVPYELALDLSTYLRVEKDYVPWTTASGLFQDLADKLLHTPAHDDLKKYMQLLIQPLYRKQTWENTNAGIIEGLLRIRILILAARSQLPDAETKIRELFSQWLNSRDAAKPVDIEPELRDLIYSNGMKSASQEVWAKMWTVYLKEEDIQEKTKLRTALSAPRNTDILKNYVSLAWDERNIRGQDYLNVLQQISNNPKGTDFIWDDVRQRWPQLVDRFTLNSRYLGNLIPSITNSFKTEDRLKEMEEFFAKYPDAGAGETARKRALETVRNNIRWANAYQSVVSTWLSSHV